MLEPSADSDEGYRLGLACCQRAEHSVPGLPKHLHLHVQVLAFEDVRSNGTLTIAVYDRRTLSANVPLGSVCPRCLKHVMPVLATGIYSLSSEAGFSARGAETCQPDSDPMRLHQRDSCQLLCVPQATLPLALLSDSRPRYLWLPLHRPAPSATAAAATTAGQARRPRPELFQRSVSDADKAGEVRVRLQWATEEAPGDGSVDALVIGLTLAGVALSLVEASVTRLPREARSLFSHICLHSKSQVRNKKRIPRCVPACMQALYNPFPS